MNLSLKIRSFLISTVFLIPIFVGAMFLNDLWKKEVKLNRKIINPNAKILILGDSHTTNGIDPKVLNKAINFSDYGESYIQDYYKLKYALNKNNSIKTVILPVDLHSLNNHRNNDILFIGYWDKYIDFIKLGKFRRKFIQYMIYKYIDIDLFDFRGEYFSLLKALKKKGSNRRHSYINQFKGVTDKYFHHNRDKKGERRALHHFLGNMWIDNEMISFFKKILDLCLERKLSLVLIKMPVSIQYYGYAGRMVPIKKYYGKVKNLINGYSNVHLLDYHDIFFNKERWKFYDSEHLNADGAKIFTSILKEDLERIGDH